MISYLYPSVSLCVAYVCAYISKALIDQVKPFVVSFHRGINRHMKKCTVQDSFDAVFGLWSEAFLCVWSLLHAAVDAQSKIRLTLCLVYGVRLFCVFGPCFMQL